MVFESLLLFMSEWGKLRSAGVTEAFSLNYSVFPCGTVYDVAVSDKLPAMSSVQSFMWHETVRIHTVNWPSSSLGLVFSIKLSLNVEANSVLAKLRSAVKDFSFKFNAVIYIKREHFSR